MSYSVPALIRDIQALCPECTILPEEPLAAHCSFRIGGPCDVMLSPSCTEDMTAIARYLREAGIRPFLMGNGTNLLFDDAPFHRVVIRLGDGLSGIRRTGNHIFAECGAPLSRIAVKAAEAGLTGFEFAHGIPGSLGGAIYMNAGAYGGEMKDVVRSVRFLDEELREQQTDTPGFSYRHSDFMNRDCILLEAEIALAPGSSDDIRTRMRELADRRRSSQPLDLPSAGSTFKRPQGGYAAALIDAAGLKGYAIGDAMVSDKHAGFIVNRGRATFAEVMQLIEHVQNEVLRTSGITLEPEVRICRS